jgi:hypothetical protein
VVKIFLVFAEIHIKQNKGRKRPPKERIII